MQPTSTQAVAGDRRTRPSISRERPLDQLRGIAILLVIASHAVQYFPTGLALVDRVCGFGRFGVQLFFIVSAYTICMMWDRRAGEPRAVQRFFFRRAARIAPAFWIALPLYLLLCGTGPSFSAPQGIGPLEVGLSAVFLHGFWPSTINAVVRGGWSIADEMMFYAIFPLLALRVYLAWAAIGSAIVSIFLFAPAVRAWLPGPEPLLEQFASLNLIQQLPAFFTGMLVYRWTQGVPVKREAWILTIGLTIVALAAALNGQARLGGPLLVILAEAALVRWMIRVAPQIPALSLLGRNSYVMYLCHFALFIGLRLLFPMGPGWTLLAFALVVSAGCLLSEVFERTLGRAVQVWVNSHVDRIT